MKLLIITNYKHKVSKQFIKYLKKIILKKLKAFTYKNYESVYIKFKGFKFEFKAE